MKAGDIIDVKGRNVHVCKYGEHPKNEEDSRIPKYHLQEDIECCATCLFVHSHYGLTCDLTPDDRGYQQGVNPLGKCDNYSKGKGVAKMKYEE